MFELMCMSLLGAAYIKACIDEAKEAEIEKEKERICDLKIKVFCYAVRHKLLYNQVVEMIQKGDLTFADIDLDKESKNG